MKNKILWLLVAVLIIFGIIFGLNRFKKVEIEKSGLEQIKKEMPEELKEEIPDVIRQAEEIKLTPKKIGKILIPFCSEMEETENQQSEDSQILEYKIEKINKTEEIKNFYLEKLPLEDWNLIFQTSGLGVIRLNFENKKNESLNIIIENEQDLFGSLEGGTILRVEYKANEAKTQ